MIFFFFFSKYLHIIIIMDTKRFKIVSCTGCHLKKKKHNRNRYQYTCLNLVGENYTGKTLPRAGKNEEKDECLCTGLSNRFASLQGGSYLVYFLRGVLPTPAELMIYRNLVKWNKVNDMHENW